MRKILLLLIALIVGLAGQTAMATTKTYVFEGQQGNSQVEFTGYFYAEGASSTHYNSTPSPWTYGSTGSLSFTLADGITLTLSSSTNKLIYLTDKGLAAQGEATLTVSGGSSYYIYHVRLLDSNGNVIQLDANGSPVTQGGASSCDYFNTTKSFTSSYPANNGVVFKKIQISYVTNIDNIADDAYQGSGTSNAPYIISSTSDLDLLAKLVNAGNDFSGKFFRQGANITYTHSSNWYDVSSTENNYTAIGTNSNPFQGTFDGNNHTISGIRIYKGGNDLPDNYQGLFGKVGQGGTVKRVNLADARITGHNKVGGIAGETYNATIEDCYVGDNVCIHAVFINSENHGGIVGYNQKIVRRCISRATLTIKSGLTGCYDFGGIVGRNNVANGGTITDCIALGVTIPNVNGHGAIVGYQYNNNNLTRNYYYNCIVGSNVTPSGVGKGNSESSTETSDVDGAQALYAITLGTNVTLNRSASATLPGTNNKTYTNGADINGQPYAYATATVSLGYTGNVPEGMAPVYSANGATISGNTLTMPAAPVTISATLAAVHYDITLSESIDHGTVTCDKATATMGETVTLTVTPDVGYAFGTLTVMNGDTPVATTAGENGTYTFTMPAAPVTVTATFVAIPFAITLPELDHGTVTCEQATAIVGETVTLTVTPEAGYALGTLTVMAGDTPIETVAGENGTYSFTMPAAPVTVTATFVAIPFAITLPESFEHGTVTCEQATAIVGETVTLTVTPEAGYALGTLTVMAGDTPIETVAGENGTYTFMMPAAPVTVTASFISEKEITVHDGTNYNYYIPVYGFGTNYYQKQEIIYPAAELAEIKGLYITQLTYYLQLQADREWAGAQFKVYMREVQQADYSGGATYLGFDEGDLVYEGPLSGTAPTMVIPLDNPYLYNGGNLLVGVYLPTKGSTYSYTTFYGETAANAAVRGYSSSSFDGLTATIENFRPKTTFYSQAVTMPRPTQVTADNINATGAIVGWTENGGATAWQLCVDDDEEHLIDTNDNPCTLTGLEPNAEHTVRVRSVDGVAHSIWSAPVTFTTLELVNKPAELTVQLTPGDGTVATLSWTECGNATAWQVSLNGDEENPISANENPFTLTGLTPETRYTARVRALDGNGNHSSWSDPVIFTPFNSLTYLVHDGEVSNQSVPVNGYDVEWFQKCESIYPARELTTIDGYYITQLTYYLQLQADQEWAGAQFKVYLREVEQADYSGGATFLGFDEGDLVYEGPLSGTAPTMVIPFEKAYHYQGGNLLVGVYQPTTGAYSETSFYGETIANASVKGSSSYLFDNIPAFNYNFLPKIAFGVSNFSIIDVTTTTASLSLINPGSATAWQVCLNGDEQNPIDVTENPFTLTGLTPDTEYTVQLRGNYSDGFSAWSVPHPFTTLELVNKPADLTVTIDPDKPTSAILSWTERGSATAWQLCLNGDEENLIDITSNPYTLKDLTLETEYTACVRALDSNGNHSGWSNTVTFTPSTLRELTVHDVSEPDYNEYVPVCGWDTDWYQKSECIYPATELASMTDADITQLTYYLAGQADEEWTGARFKVYLREVEQTEYGEDCYNFLGFDEGDLVYEGELSGTAPTMVIPFDTPYTYHGGNLLVGIYEVQTGNYSPAYFLGEQVGTISSVIGYGYSSLDAVGINEFLHFLPKTTFGYVKEMGVPGDVNGDGEVTTVDVTAIYNYLLNGDETFIDTCDVDGDGYITTGDITFIYNILLGNKK